MWLTLPPNLCDTWIAVTAATAMLVAKNTEAVPIEVSGAKHKPETERKRIPEGKRKTN